MPDMVPESNICLVCHRIFQLQEGFFEDELAEEATWGSQHPCHVGFAKEQKESLTSALLKPSAKMGRIISCSLSKEEPEKILSILLCVHPDMKCKWQHRSSANCMSQKSTSSRVDILP